MRVAIQVDRLRKSYGSHVVLNGLNFCVRQGEIFALLGVNGAGKTTALECIEGLRKLDEGSIVINGQMGIQLQSASLPAHIRPLEAVKMFAKWNRTVPDKAMLDALGICEFAKKQYFQLSAGQKRRLHLALALTRHPDILFLDEPTAGLDVEGRSVLHEQIRKLKANGKTIVLTSHDMTEIENLCDRFAILSHGRAVFIGTVKEFGDLMGKHYDITIQTEKRTENYVSEHIGETLLALLTKYQASGETVLDIRINRGSLEQYFMKIAKGK